MVNIYGDAKHQGIYPPLFTDPEGYSCFIIKYLPNQMDKKNVSSINFFLLKLSQNDAPFFSLFAKQ